MAGAHERRLHDARVQELAAYVDLHGSARVRGNTRARNGALECRGILVYPRVSEDIDATYEVSETQVTLRTVDLATPALGDLRQFAGEMAALVSEPSREERPRSLSGGDDRLDEPSGITKRSVT